MNAFPNAFHALIFSKIDTKVISYLAITSEKSATVRHKASLILYHARTKGIDNVMSMLDLITSPNPVRQICDYFHIYPPWEHRLNNIVSTTTDLLSLDIVKTAGPISKIIHIQNIDGIGLAIVDTEETISIKY